MLGWFDTVGTQVIHKWAKWDGEQWSPGGANEPIINQTQACARYQGDYYVGGNFSTQNGIDDLAKWAGGAWHSLGSGLHGDPWVNDLMVYDDLLWVAGNFFAGAGNAATGLMAWDGSNWINKFPQIQFTAQCKDLAIIDHKLYFSGPFLVQGLVGEYRIGQYDGHTLCILGGPDIYAGRITGSADTLYAQACVYLYCETQQGLQANGVMKWPLDAPADTCFAIAQSLPELNTSHQIQLYPNPTNDQVTIALGQELSGSVIKINVLNMLGQIVPCEVVIRPTSITISTAVLATGTYTMEALDRDRKVVYLGRFLRVP
jgi:hypothetical protein